MNPITVFQLASWTIGLWDYWLVGIEAGAGPIEGCNDVTVQWAGAAVPGVGDGGGGAGLQSAGGETVLAHAPLSQGGPGSQTGLRRSFPQPGAAGI